MKGQLDAPTRDEVGAYLRKNRLILVNIREAPKQIKLSFGGQRSRRATSSSSPGSSPR